MRRTVVLALLLAVSGCGGDTPGGAQPDTAEREVGRTEAADTQERTVSLNGRTLVLDGFAGDVRIETDARAPGVRVRFRRVARGATQASARNRLGLMRIDEAGDEEIYQYVWRAETDPSEGLSVDAVATVPPGTSVVVRLESGGVAADGLSGDLDVVIGSGAIVMGRIASPRLRVVVGTGDVTINALRLPTGAVWGLEAGAGSLDLSLPRDASARINATTGAGRVRDRGLNLTQVERSEGAAGGRLRARLGDGSATVRLHAGAGSVFVGGPTDIDGTELGQVADSSDA